MILQLFYSYRNSLKSSQNNIVSEQVSQNHLKLKNLFTNYSFSKSRLYKDCSQTINYKRKVKLVNEYVNVFKQIKIKIYKITQFVYDATVGVIKTIKIITVIITTN